MKQRAFTLVELLVVIGIIAVLSGLVLPAVTKARGRGSQVTCANNLQQLGNAISQYGADYQHYLVPAGGTKAKNWYVQLFPYVKDEALFTCDAAEDTLAKTVDKDDISADADVTLELSYLVNTGVHREWNGDSSKPLKTYAVEAPSKSISLAPNNAEKGGTLTMAGLSDISDSYKKGTDKYPDLERHPGQTANYLFVDGHVTSMTRQKLVDDKATFWKAW